MKPIPVFTGCENSLYTVRVPREYLSPSSPTPTTKTKTATDEPSPLEEICRRRQLWGTEIYTDDSDVIAAAVHSGWLCGDFGPEANADLHDLDLDENPPTNPSSPSSSLALTTKPAHPVLPPAGHEAHISLLLLPPLDSYASTTTHHLTSREWNTSTPHDGLSFAIHGIKFVQEGDDSRGTGRSGRERKARLGFEEERRREAVEGLLLFKARGAEFANAAGTGTGTAGAARGEVSGRSVGVGA
ncbi:hypothetical protein MBLNU230_g8296t1 [Neophaeotheca triangularis]